MNSSERLNEIRNALCICGIGINRFPLEVSTSSHVKNNFWIGLAHRLQKRLTVENIRLGPERSMQWMTRRCNIYVNNLIAGCAVMLDQIRSDKA